MMQEISDPTLMEFTTSLRLRMLQEFIKWQMP